MNEYETIIDEAIDSFFEEADSKEDYDQIIEALKSAIQRTKEKKKDFIEDMEEEDDDDDDDDFDDDDEDDDFEDED